MGVGRVAALLTLAITKLLCSQMVVRGRGGGARVEEKGRAGLAAVRRRWWWGRGFPTQDLRHVWAGLRESSGCGRRRGWGEGGDCNGRRRPHLRQHHGWRRDAVRGVWGGWGWVGGLSCEGIFFFFLFFFVMGGVVGWVFVPLLPL